MSKLDFIWLFLLINPLLLTALALGLRSFWQQKPAQLTKLAATLVRGVDLLSKTILEWVKWFALLMVLITTALVISRYVFGVGSLKAQESVIYLHAGLFLFAAAGTLLYDGHVRVDVLFSRLNTRDKTIINLLGSLFFLIPMCLLILFFSHGYVAQSWKFLEGSPEADGLHLVFLLKSAIPAFAILMLLQASAQVLRAVLYLVGQPLTPVKPHTEMV